VLRSNRTIGFTLLSVCTLSAGEPVSPFPADPDQALERTSFQTSQAWGPSGNLPADVAMVYGLGINLPERVQSWRERGYRVHLMTGVSWGGYQDYLYGRFDGINHEDEVQTERNGKKISHGGDVYYMCPGTNYGKFLCVGIQRALDAGVEAVHLEEPEFWVRGGYSEGFKREWRSYYDEEWQPPHSSVDAQWRTSKLKYFLYRRALQQVFDYVQAYNQRSGRKVRCYVPTHSLINYAQWGIVSPESSLARLNGCDGYIAQVWTGTSRTPNMYRGELRERTFETAFLEYGAMQNLVRSTGRRVWYLNDPIEDNPNHTWEDYRSNWESTLTASLLQPEVWRFEVAPWPERIFNRTYPRNVPRAERKGIPAAYSTELQTVMQALNDMNQTRVEWDCGTRGVGVLVSDSLMFERGDPSPSDAHLGQVYGLALPLLKRGMPVTPVQLENLSVRGYLDPVRILLLSYHGMKPLSAEVHGPLVKWVKGGGVLVVVDDDGDPFNRVREWWNTGGRKYAGPREELFEELGLTETNFGADAKSIQVGKGRVTWLRKNPAVLARMADGDAQLVACVKEAGDAVKVKWLESSYLLLRRGPYVIGAGLNESEGDKTKVIDGRFVNLFDSELKVRKSFELKPGSRFLLLDLDSLRSEEPRVLASAGKVLLMNQTKQELSVMVEGIGGTEAVILLGSARKPPRSVTLNGEKLETFEHSRQEQLIWIRFRNESKPRQLTVEF
jgi:hypothetical protein